MKRLAAGLGFFVATALPAHAASFDCAKARTPVEKAICSAPALSAADEALSDVYGRLLVINGDNQNLAEEQKNWLKQRDATPAANLLALHQARIAELSTRLAEATKPIDHGSLAGACVPIPAAPKDVQCKVDGFGKLADDASMSWQLQIYGDPDNLPQRASVVVAGIDGQPGKDSLVAALYTEDGFVDQPAGINNAFGRFLQLPSEADGTGHFNQGVLLVSTPDGWRSVDTSSWQNAFAKRLKGGLYAAKGIFPNYTQMTAETPLWKGDDPNCCPTGGYARIKLGYKNQRVTFEDVKVALGEKAAGGE